MASSKRNRRESTEGELSIRDTIALTGQTAILAIITHRTMDHSNDAMRVMRLLTRVFRREPLQNFGMMSGRSVQRHAIGRPLGEFQYFAGQLSVIHRT